MVCGMKLFLSLVVQDWMLLTSLSPLCRAFLLRAVQMLLLSWNFRCCFLIIHKLMILRNISLMELMVSTDASVSSPASCAICCLSASLTSHILPGPDRLGFRSLFWKSLWSKEIQTWFVCSRFSRNTSKANSQMIKWFKVKRDKMHFSLQTEINVLKLLRYWHVAKT